LTPGPSLRVRGS